MADGSRPDFGGLALHADVVTPELEAALLATVSADTGAGDPACFVGLRADSYGARYQHWAQCLEPCADPFPEWCAPVCAALGVRFNQLTVTEFMHGADMGRRRDAPCCGEVIVLLALGAPLALRFNKHRHPDVAVTLPRRGAAVLTGHARTAWAHSVDRHEGERCVLFTLRDVEHAAR